jgi:membrane associated rhomboid family serine protease
MKSLSVILIFIHVLLSLAVQETQEIYELLGLSLSGVSQGRLWEFVSYGLLHGSWWHLAVNVSLVLLLGTKIQRILGVKKSILVVLLGIVVGGLGHLLFNLFLPVTERGVLVGISGGAMALLLCLTTLDPDTQLRGMRIRFKHLGMGFLLSALLLTLLTPSLEIVGFTNVGAAMVQAFGGDIFYVSHACHFGGGLAGLLYGHFILRKFSW